MEDTRRVRLVLEANVRHPHPMIVPGQTTKLAHGGRVHDEEWIVADLEDVTQESLWGQKGPMMQALKIATEVSLALGDARLATPDAVSREDGHVVLEWWRGERRVALWAGSGGAYAIKSWGSNIHQDMEGKTVSSGEDLAHHLRWLREPSRRSSKEKRRQDASRGPKSPPSLSLVDRRTRPED